MPDYPLLPGFSGLDDQLNKQRRLLDQELRAPELMPHSYSGVRAQTTDQYTSWTEDVYENMPWQICDSSDLSLLTTERPHMTPIFLRKGDELYGMSYISGATALSGTTYYAFSINEPIYPFRPIAVTNNGAVSDPSIYYSSAWTAETLKLIQFSEPFIVPQTGLFYASIAVKATTVPTLVGRTTHGAVSAYGLPGMTGSTYSTGLTPNTYAEYIDPDIWAANTTAWTVDGRIPYVRVYRRNDEPTIVS